MRVLIVEGDGDLQEQWSGAFTSAGHDVYSARSVEVARRALMTRTFDVALIELCLPDGSGLTMSTLAKYSNPDCCIILVTGSGLFPHGELFDIAPAITTILRKPVNARELLAVAEHYHRAETEMPPYAAVEKKKGDDTREEEGAAA